MEAILFMLFAAAVAVVGIGLGLAVAPRLSRWDERHGRAESPDVVEGKENLDRD